MTGEADVQELLIVGAGGHGREVLDIVEAVNRQQPTWRFTGFLDDGPTHEDRLRRRGATVQGPVADLAHATGHYVAALGSSQVREAVDDLAASGRARPAVLVHPSAVLGGDVELGPGSVVAAGSHLTTNVRTGRHVHINVAAVISHDCRLEDYVTISPGCLLNGGVTIGRHAFLGTGSIVVPGRTVGAGARVGAGAVVVDDLPGGVVATGVPARVRRTV